MIWKHGTLYALAETGEEDELGNPVVGQAVLWSGEIRFTPWTDEDVTVNGRDVTRNEQRYAIPVSYEAIKNAEQIELDGVMLNITAVSDLGPRWAMIQTEVYKK